MQTKHKVLIGALVLLVGVILASSLCVPAYAPTDVPPTDQEGHVDQTPPPKKNVASTAIVVRAPAADAGASAASSTVVTATWGSGRGQLGRERRQEGNAEGPMSLLSARNGDVLVLDQSNGRLARFGGDGKWKDSAQLPVQSAQDIAQTSDGKTLVLDRLSEGHVAILDKDGKPIGELPVTGTTVKEAGGVTGLFVDGDDVYVEQEHGTLARIGDTKGMRDEAQPEIPGRPSRDGKFYVSAGIVEPQAGRLFVNAIDREKIAQRFTREYRLEPVTAAILLLDTDASGVIYLAVLSDLGEKQEVTLLCLDPLDGRPLGSASLPPNTMPEESFRDFAVIDSGGVLYSYRTEQGVEVRKYDCR
ncbi:MAG: hypothetical protein ACJ790_08790 [Myxococcaceae bacterium]